MLGLTGQLGKGSLGAFELAAVSAGIVFVPHRGAATSSLTSLGATSALTSNKASSTLSAARAKSEVTNE